MGTTSSKRSYYSSGISAINFTKLFERAGATPEEIHDISRKGNEGFARQCLGAYRGTHEIVEIGLFDPQHAFRKDQKGLRASNNFEKYILSVAKKIPQIKLPDHVLGFDLPEPMNDEQVRDKLGDNHVFETSEGCAVIAGMISRQANGEAGDLLNNGYTDIFYVRGKNNEVFTVVVGWSAGVREWFVDADRLDDYPWLAGRRAFSLNSILGK